MALGLWVGLGGILRGEEKAPAAEVVVWRLENIGKVGGNAVEVIGAPKIVDGAAIFDGVKDGLLVGANPLAGWREFTIEVLFRPADDAPAEQRFLHVQDTATSRALIETRVDGTGSWWLDTYLMKVGKEGRPLIDPKKKHPIGRWHWVALRYDGKIMTHFVNGEKEREGSVEFGPMLDGRVSLGVRQNRVHWFKGAIREVRFTPLALAEDKLQRLKL
ncbi:MAG: LamG domain-containing protein [Verrucomicrobia bacterium]|nr:LamG domain-containing protein [Verrucomicrobiota bacterium]